MWPGDRLAATAGDGVAGDGMAGDGMGAAKNTLATQHRQRGKVRAGSVERKRESSDVNTAQTG